MTKSQKEEAMIRFIKTAQKCNESARFGGLPKNWAKTVQAVKGFDKKISKMEEMLFSF